MASSQSSIVSVAPGGVSYQYRSLVAYRCVGGLSSRQKDERVKLGVVEYHHNGTLDVAHLHQLARQLTVDGNNRWNKCWSTSVLIRDEPIVESKP